MLLTCRFQTLQMKRLLLPWKCHSWFDIIVVEAIVQSDILNWCLDINEWAILRQVGVFTYHVTNCRRGSLMQTRDPIQRILQTIKLSALGHCRGYLILNVRFVTALFGYAQEKNLPPAHLHQPWEMLHLCTSDSSSQVQVQSLCRVRTKLQRNLPLPAASMQSLEIGSSSAFQFLKLDWSRTQSHHCSEKRLESLKRRKNCMLAW